MRVWESRAQSFPRPPEGIPPGRTAEIRIDGRFAGISGEIHPRISDEIDLKETFASSWIWKCCWMRQRRISSSARFRAIRRPPGIWRSWSTRTFPPPKWRRPGNPQGRREHLDRSPCSTCTPVNKWVMKKKSLAYSLVYRAEDRTLTDEEVAKFHQAVVDELERAFGARLRA